MGVKTYCHSIGKVRLWARCDESVGRFAEGLLAETAAVSTQLREGYSIDMGGVIYWLRAVDDGWRVVTYDLAADAERRVTDDLSLPLYVLSTQLSFARECELEPEFVSPRANVTVLSGWDTAKEVFAIRMDRKNEGHSGWTIGPIGAISQGTGALQDDSETIPLDAVMQGLPSLIQAVALPTGYIVLASEAGPDAVLRIESGATVWRARKEK